jgi:hypothetical protein
MFPSPHKFDKELNYNGSYPRVVFTHEAMEKQRHLVDLCEVEVGWLGTVERDGNVFTVTEIHVFDQEVSAATTNLDASALSEYGAKLMEEERFDDIERIRYWGHSHHNMGTSPSGQDERTLLNTFGDCDYAIRAILNKRGRVEISICFFDKDIRFDDVPWSVQTPSSDPIRQDMQKELDEKVSRTARIGYNNRSWYTGRRIVRRGSGRSYRRTSGTTYPQNPGSSSGLEEDESFADESSTDEDFDDFGGTWNEPEETFEDSFDEGTVSMDKQDAPLFEDLHPDTANAAEDEATTYPISESLEEDESAEDNSSFDDEEEKSDDDIKSWVDRFLNRE